MLRGIRSLLAPFVITGAACVEHAPIAVAPATAILRLEVGAVTAQVGELGATEILLSAGYRRSGGELATLAVSPAVVPVLEAQFSPSLEIDVGRCIGDALAVADTGGARGCYLQLQLLLVDAAGVRLDSVVLRPADRVVRGGPATLDTVSLGGAAVISVTPGAATLVPGDSVHLAISARTRTGVPVNRTVTFASSDSTVAIVSASRRLVALGFGTATVSVSADGSTTQTSVTVRPWTDSEAAALLANAVALQVRGTAGMLTTFEGVYAASGLLADEWQSGDTFTQRDNADRRSIPLDDQLSASLYRHVINTRSTAQRGVAAYTRLVQESPGADSLRARLAQAYFAQGLAEVTIAEAFCAGSAFVGIDPQTARRTFGRPETLAETYARAEASFAAAIAQADAVPGDALGIEIAAAARVGRARTYLERAQYAAALAVASEVPAGFVSVAEYGPTFATGNSIWAMNVARRGYSLANVEGGNGLPFRTPADARLPSTA